MRDDQTDAQRKENAKPNQGNASKGTVMAPIPNRGNWLSADQDASADS